MMAISGTNESTCPTPAMRPFSTRPRIAPPAPSASSRRPAPVETGPSTSPWKAAMSGAAAFVVSANTAHMTARKIGGPNHREVSTRSTRSDQVARPAPRRVTTSAITSCTHAYRCSAISNSGSSGSSSPVGSPPASASPAARAAAAVSSGTPGTSSPLRSAIDSQRAG